METYSTIQEAFLKGLGDVFFAKDNKYTCVHRNHVDKHNLLLNDGFVMLSYDETIRLAGTTQKTAPAVEEKPKHEASKPVFKNSTYSNYNPYYNNDAYEYSDADSGL